MNLQYLTEDGRRMYDKALDSGLVKWYDPMNGNFIFEPLEFYENQTYIFEFLKEHSNYGLSYIDDLESWILYDVTFC